MSGKRKPIKFKRMADALLEEGWMTKELGGSSSGSDHFTSGSLSDLVNSFIQKVEEETPNDGRDVERDPADGEEFDDSDNSSSNDERKGLLKKLLGYGDGDDSVAEFRRNIIQEIEAGFRDQINISRRDWGFKRGLMVHLRERGYDAGLCKSRWEKSRRHPAAGTYEYVDIITSCGASSRYMVEIFPAGQFEIARPTDGYTALLEEFPCIFIGKPETLKQIVRLMSAAMKESLKSSALQVAPWRRNSYLQAQWFAPYKRTTNVFSTGSTPAGSLAPQPNGKIRRAVVGFVEQMNLPAAKGVMYNCNREFSSKGGISVGLLAAAFQGKLSKSTSSN